MKSKIALFAIFLVLTLVQAQITTISSNVAANLKIPLISDLLIVNNLSADCFQGNVNTNLN
jgi:hypothetical protein